jgi:hypothetical protein
MLSPLSLSILKITFITLGAATVIFKAMRIYKYNSKKDEPIDLNLFGRFSSMEIDGSYSSERKHILIFCNKMTALLYLCILLLVLAYFLPKIADSLGLL